MAIKRQLVFPCGASYDLHDEAYPLDGAHVFRDGSMSMVVAGTGCTRPDRPSGGTAPCFTDCLKPGRHRKQQRVHEGPSGDKRGWITTCVGRLVEDGIDTTPLPTGSCAHCREQRAYDTAVAGSGDDLSDRQEFAEQFRQSSAR